MDDPASAPFLLGVNYWPAGAAMYWWRQFDKSALREDLERIREAGLKIVRLFLLWEDFQPRARKVSTPCLDHLVEVAEKADERGLFLVPTFFTGHMNGVNWLPPWALWAKEGELRTPTYSLGKVRHNLPRNFYEDAEIIEAQVLLVREVSGALQGHPAVRAWDLGNRPSCVASPSDDQNASVWLRVMTEELRGRDETIPITLSMDEEDLWKDRTLRSQDAAGHLDFLSMQAPPFASELASGPKDSCFPPFLGLITKWLVDKDVLFTDFGIATEPVPKPKWSERTPEADRLVSEEEAAGFFESVLDRMHGAGMMGATVSCYSDYDPRLWDMPPLDHEVLGRHLGIFRRDGSPKGFLPILGHYGSLQRRAAPEEPPSWIDISREEYEEDPQQHIRRLYRNYRDHHADG